MDFLIDIFLDALIDSIKLLPFLFITYLIMEYIEHKTNKKVENMVKKSGKYGPLAGAILGMVVSDSIAILLGKFLSHKVSETTMQKISSLLFIFFGIVGLIFLFF